jgi:tetratricopeptide (TPR) repeat protein
MNHSKNAFSICLVSVAMGLLLVLPNAIADGPLGHDAAIVALGYPEEKERLAAAERLGDIGTMEDVHYLLGSLRDESENVRNRAEASIWQIWSHSGSSAIDQMFERGVREMTERNFSRAISTFSEIIRAKPDFAEAWNKRATLYFMTRQYQKSMQDCDEVIKLNPNHFGALAGYGQIYIELDQLEKALEYFQRALNVNPNLVVVANTMHKLERILHKRKDNIV